MKTPKPSSQTVQSSSTEPSQPGVGLSDVSTDVDVQSSSVQSGWRVEFGPEFECPSLPEGFVDASWHHDELPHYLHEASGIEIYMNRPGANLREGAARFVVMQADTEAYGKKTYDKFATNDWDTAVEHARGLIAVIPVKHKKRELQLGPIVTANYCVEMSREQFDTLEAYDFLTQVKPAIRGAGGNDAEYNGHFGANIMFESAPEYAPAVLEVIKKLVGNGFSKEQKRSLEAHIADGWTFVGLGSDDSAEILNDRGKKLKEAYIRADGVFRKA